VNLAKQRLCSTNIIVDNAINGRSSHIWYVIHGPFIDIDKKNRNRQAPNQYIGFASVMRNSEIVDKGFSCDYIVNDYEVKTV